jgi:hypothetical protein
LYVWTIRAHQRKVVKENEMPVKYRKLFWPTVVLIVVTSSALAFVPARMRKVTPPVAEQSLLTAGRTDEGLVSFPTLKTSERQVGELLITASAKSEAVANPQGQSSEEQVEVEVVTVRASGFEPREITRPHGAFRLAITNHSGATEILLHLDRVQGNRLHEVRLPQGRISWTQVLNLPPGDYVLSEQNHPDWICLIQLTAR